jgi:hypothetical protein
MTAEPSKVVEDFNAQSGAMRTDILAKRRAMPFAEKDSAHSKPSLHLSQNVQEIQTEHARVGPNRNTIDPSVFSISYCSFGHLRNQSILKNPSKETMDGSL